MAAKWGFLTNHGRALLCIAHDPDVRLRDLATTLEITERSAYAIVSDLTEAGYVLKNRDGRSIVASPSQRSVSGRSATSSRFFSVSNSTHERQL